MKVGFRKQRRTDLSSSIRLPLSENDRKTYFVNRNETIDKDNLLWCKNAYSKPVGQRFNKNSRESGFNPQIRRVKSAQDQTVRPRHINFDSLKLTKLDSDYNRVSLSDRSIEELSFISVPSEEDYQWLEEKDRIVRKLTAEGKTKIQIDLYLQTNPPLGRPQHTKRVSRFDPNYQQTKIDRLHELLREINNQRIAQNQLQKQLLTAELARIFDSIKVIENMNRATQLSITEALGRLDASNNLDYESLDLPRYIDSKAFNTNRGLIILCLLATNRKLNKGSPYIFNKSDGNTVNLKSILDQRSQASKFFDLGTATILTVSDIVQITGGDIGELNNNKLFDITVDQSLIELYQESEESEEKSDEE